MALTHTVTAHQGLEGLIGLESAWREVFSAMPEARAHHGWEAAYAYATTGPRAEQAMTYLALSDDHGVAAIVPLERREDRALGMPITVLGLPWDDEWPLGDIVARDDSWSQTAAEAALTWARGRASMLVAGPLPASSAVWDGVRGSGAASAIYPQMAWNQIGCAGTFDAYFSALKKNFRGNLRKARNRLAALDGVEFRCVGGPEEVAREFSTFMAVEASGWKGAEGTAIACRPQAEAWYRTWLEAMARQGLVEMNALYLEGACIASQVCVRTRDVYEIHKIGYDESHARLAPGQLLLERTLRRCFDDPSLNVVELMSDTSWQYDWAPTGRPMCMGRVALGFGGTLLMPLVRFRFGAARSLVRRFRAMLGS